MMQNRLRGTWDAGGQALNAWLALPSPVSAELVASHDFDAVTLDLQHGLIDYQAAVPMLQAMAAW